MTRILSCPRFSLSRRNFVAALVFAASGLASTSAFANPLDFQSWLAALRDEARSTGISQRTVQEALTDVQPIDRVLELDRKQPEFTLTFREYLAKVVNDVRVEKGRRLLDENRSLLEEISKRYGVQPRFIVAL